MFEDIVICIFTQSDTDRKEEKEHVPFCEGSIAVHG